MAYSIVRTDAFEGAYDAAISYLLHTLMSPNAAKHLMECVEKAANTLAQSPFINAVSKKRYLVDRNLREHFFMNYAIVYLVKENTVIFVNLFHQTQDYNSTRYREE